MILLSDSLTTTDLVDGAEKRFHHLAGRVVSTVHEPARPRLREELDDARLLDLDAEQESPFLRGQKRVSVRRGLPKKSRDRPAWGSRRLDVVVLFGSAAVAAALSLRRALVALPHRIQRRHRSRRPSECHPLTNHGSHGRRHWPQHLLYPLDRPQASSWSKFLGGIRQRHAIRSESPARSKFMSALPSPSPASDRKFC